MTFHENLARLSSAQKPGAGVPAYTRWVNRRLARFVAATAATWGLSANAVTWISAGLSLCGLIVLVAAPLTWWSGLVVAVLLAAGYVLDSADGQVARLTGTGGPAGEWLDHVVDAIRTPTIHVAVAVAVWLHGAPLWVAGVALAYSVLSAGQFISQILAEQLRRAHGADAQPLTGGVLKSFVILPSDMGAVCWVFVFWGIAPVFAVVYTLLFAVNLVHGGVSMLRKYRQLKAV